MATKFTGTAVERVITGLVGVFLPVIVQVTTGAVSWRVAVPTSAGVAVAYLLGNSHVAAVVAKTGLTPAQLEADATVSVARLTEHTHTLPVNNTAPQTTGGLSSGSIPA